MTLIDGWRRRWWRLWSVRLILLSAAIQTLAALWPALDDQMPSPIFVAVGVLVGIAAAIARLVAQPRLDDQ